MEFHEAAGRLTALQRRRPKLGVETTRTMLAALGDPQDDLDFVQVAGSNGKGSTVWLLESVLDRAGLRVGAFTSPSLDDFREQIRVDGRRIPRERVTEFVERILPCLEELRAADDEPTHFEVLTALAIYHFAAADADVGVLEVGIGGRYDATSAVEPIASAVTSVSLEHTDLLGDTVEEIARDKAQVVPSGTPLVTGASGPALAAIRTETDVVSVAPSGADVTASEEGMRGDVESRVAIDGPDWAVETGLSLLGQHQATNAGVAATLARQVATIDPGVIGAGLRTVTVPGRFERMATDPTVILDGAHNPASVATLPGLLDRFSFGDLHVVFAAMRDKDHEGMIEALPSVDSAVVTRPAVDRAAGLDALATAFDGHATQVSRIASVPEATERALSDATASDAVLVTGSLYAVAEARDRWTRAGTPLDRSHRPLEPDDVAGATFEPRHLEGAQSRAVSLHLRPPQADRVVERFEALGGDAVRTDRGTPEAFDAVILRGAPDHFRGMIDAVADAGHGLAALAEHFERVCERAVLPPPFDGTGRPIVGTIDLNQGATGGSANGFGSADERDLDSVLDGARRHAAVGSSHVAVRVGPGPESRGGRVDIDPDRSDWAARVVGALADLDVSTTVRTSSAAVAGEALAAGAAVVADESGLADPEMRFVVADHDATLVLGPGYGIGTGERESCSGAELVSEIGRTLGDRMRHAVRAGVDPERILLEPCAGVRSSPEATLSVLDRLPAFRGLGCPLLVQAAQCSNGPEPDSDNAVAGLLPQTITALAAERGVDVIAVDDVTVHAGILRALS